MKQVIDRTELLRRLASATPPTLVEALPEKYYRDGHLPGALHLPHTQVRELAPALLPDKAASVVVYCASASCQNSHIAAGVLGQLGYTDVAVYSGGKQDWTEAGLELQRESLAA
ncbi:MAG: rhodanese-like domain-containing protein [Betaproteobacteria bacterium]